jgi:CheY-like chemotaxis protein
MELLLVNDDATDWELFMEAISLAGESYPVKEAQKGAVAPEYLQLVNQLPGLVLLDLLLVKSPDFKRVDKHAINN